jgi:hypothetical protein
MIGPEAECLGIRVFCSLYKFLSFIRLDAARLSWIEDASNEAARVRCRLIMRNCVGAVGIPRRIFTEYEDTYDGTHK